MRLRAALYVSCVVSLIVGSAIPGLAGSLPPCIKAASAKNGNFLVLVNMQLDPPPSKEGVPRKIRGFSFEIVPKEDFINAKDKLTGPGTFWSGNSWADWVVTLDSRNATDGLFTSSCPLSLVTDDGEFLVLLAQRAAGSADWGVLRIYQWDRKSGGIPGSGRLVEELPLKKFYFPLFVLPCCTDETPTWFAGASWNFSADDRQLIYKSQYGNTVRISLGNGSVSSE